MPKKDKKGDSLFTKAVMNAAFSENPAGLTASGWRVNRNGDVTVGDETSPENRKLAKTLAAIGTMPLGDLATEATLGAAAYALMKIPGVRKTVTAVKAARELNKAVKKSGNVSTIAVRPTGVSTEASLLREFPASSSDASITRVSGYSGYTPTSPSKAETGFVRDIDEVLDWEAKRGSPFPAKSDYIDLSDRYYRDRGREAYIYPNLDNPDEVLKVMHHYAVPGEGIYPLPNFSSVDDAVEFAEKYVKDRNARPYNLVENVVGVTDNMAGGYAPVLSQKRVIPADQVLNKTWEEVDDAMTRFGERIGDRHYTMNIRARADRPYVPEKGRMPTNNIIYENDFQKTVTDPNTGKVYFETKDLKKDNVGFLEDGSIIGFDVFKSGGPIEKNRIKQLAKRINETSNADFVKRLLDKKVYSGFDYSDGGPIGFAVPSLLLSGKIKKRYLRDYINNGAVSGYPMGLGSWAEYIISPYADTRFSSEKGKDYDMARRAIMSKYTGVTDGLNFNPDDYIEESPYKPSNSKDPDAKYYRPKSNGEEYHGAIFGAVAGNYKVDKGEDENGRYASFYDVWDLAPFSARSGRNEIRDTSPVELYDRVYERDDPFSYYIYFPEDKPKRNKKKVEYKKLEFSHGGPISEAINNGKLDIIRAAINNVKNRKLR